MKSPRESWLTRHPWTATVHAATTPVVAVLVLAVLAPAAPCEAQERWSWPDEPENLMALPEDTDGARLRAVMTGFTRALGVRCQHCHVGEEGTSFSEWDFAADDKPAKRTARAMLFMLKTINDELSAIPTVEKGRVNVWCHTCHGGKPIPWTLEEALMAAYGEGGAEALVERYGELRERYAGRGAYDFGEGRLNALGYRLLGEGDTEGAIAVFRLNAERFPASGNVYDSLAEGYMTAGKTELARIYYERSLEVDPDNDNALTKLGELREGAAAGDEK